MKDNEELKVWRLNVRGHRDLRPWGQICADRDVAGPWEHGGQVEADGAKVDLLRSGKGEIPVEQKYVDIRHAIESGSRDLTRAGRDGEDVDVGRGNKPQRSWEIDVEHLMWLGRLE